MRRRHDSWSGDEPTVRCEIPSQAEQEARILAAHDARAPQFPEFAPAGRTYSVAEMRADLETTQPEMPALPDPDREPSWRQVLAMGVKDIFSEVLS